MNKTFPVNEITPVPVQIQKFWLVKGNGATNMHHPSKEVAVAEAHRLAKQIPGQRFFVAETIMVVSYAVTEHENQEL